MSKDRTLKKSIFGGFNRADVLDYIEKLQQENVALAQEVRDISIEKTQLQKENSELEEQIEELKSAYESREEEEDEKTPPLIKDAIKYSDSIVKGAKESAGKALSEASSAINSATEEISRVNKTVKDSKTSLETALSEVKSSMDSVLDCLSKCSEQLSGAE